MVKNNYMLAVFFVLNIIGNNIYVSGDAALDCVDVPPPCLPPDHWTFAIQTGQFTPGQIIKMAMQDAKFIYYQNYKPLNQDGWSERLDEYHTKGCSNCGVIVDGYIEYTRNNGKTSPILYCNSL
ncbi:uncharacterized protein LOC132950874 isoform X1 [Metopolophium dirhodum]|uniref:uncharacterized protein LOC132950874 isoform X1 n=1 Tax=Metopolophium dirhodum TaxID=44670 RepID=UPI00298FCE02|nr:uncharacterized protein LOC132950874 isoform X1 [Metopolophium dirhodum]